MPAPLPLEPSPSSRSPVSRRIGVAAARVFEPLARLQTARPFMVLAVALLTVFLAGLGASRLKLKTSLGELLPANKESVIVAEKVRERLISASTLYIVAESKDTAALKRFVDALAPELRALPPGLLGAVDDGVREAQAFFAKNKILYAPIEDVQKVHDQILERYEAEVQKAAGFDLGLDDEGEGGGAGEGPPPLTAESIKKKIAEHKDPVAEKYPDGYYLAPEGDLIVITTRTPVSAGDVDRAEELLATLQGVVDRVDPARFAPDMKVTFTGGLITSIEEYSQIKGDLTDVGVLSVAMVLGVVFLFYLRLRPLFAMALTVGIGLTWSFGLAWALIGHLNSSTGFLASVIVGNGINFGIIYMARFFEARAEGDVARAVRTAHLDTWAATLGAAGAASVAYGSLVVTDFRGFKHFGVMGGLGMMMCWLATYLFLPSILVITDRASSAVGGAVASRAPRLAAAGRAVMGLADRMRASYGRPFAFLVGRFPRAIAALGVIAGLGGLALSVHYIASDPMEYDMSNTRTVPRTAQTYARVLLKRVDKIVGRGQDGIAIMVDRIEQVRPLRAALEAKRDAAPAAQKPFERVADIFDLLPADQERKIALIKEARDRLERAHRRGMITDADWAEIQQHVPGGEIRPLDVADLPEQVARMFIEKDGTRGRLVYIVPTRNRSVWDGRYLMEWADSFRETKLPDGSIVKGSGNAVIFADLLLAIVEDAPKAILVSFACTLLIIVATFRGRAPAAAAIASLGLGLVWMMSVLALHGMKVRLPPDGPIGVDLVGMKLNFLNFVSLPISIGVGADYAINVMQRHLMTGGDAAQVPDVIVKTGGAVVLCSCTAVLGYLGLTFSINNATASFGFTSAAGELCCLLAAVFVLPSFLILFGRRAAPAGSGQLQG